jgi:hypothetical protein
MKKNSEDGIKFPFSLFFLSEKEIFQYKNIIFAKDYQIRE